MLTIVFVLTAYLLGSISFAIIACKLFKLPDPRTYGSGNPGATNVLRSGKKAAAILTLVGDSAKGWLAVFLAIHYAPTDNVLIAAVTLAVFLGHLYPIFLRFQGGKGVATALGVLLALNLWVGLGVLLTWIAVAALFRYSSLAALLAAIAAPIYLILLGLPHEWIIASAVMSLFLIYRHKNNIENLMRGKESRIGKK
ncbi:MAG: glycerol-3-phosphate 1-O-acyltransferase PlsY [Gallionella sp.]|nr:glycerol-3-phosphate 1-O-acyltransferase PlsY [Gallionella sp.]MDD4959044.1 glycerol-3-phosphate 1-O-acyltransferase PlsY [Gallionella sp.]